MGYPFRLSWLLRILVFTTAASIAFTTFDGSLFGWHPFAMSLGYVYYMAEGLILAWHFRTLDGMQRVQGIEQHALVQAVAFLLSGVGFATIAYNKTLHGKPHFTTLHGKCGLAALLLTAAAPLLGAISFRKWRLIYWFPERWHNLLKWCHREVGTLAWVLGMAAVQLGLKHRAKHHPVFTPFWQAATAVATFMMMLLLRKRRQAATSIPLKNV